MSDRPGHRQQNAASEDAATRFDAAWLTAAAKGALVRAGHTPISGGAVDSRQVARGNAFFALSGEHTDGHRFLEAAVEAGAGALVVSEELSAERQAALDADGRVTIVRVADPAVALRAVAARYRDRFRPLVVGITGSLAKTSTKEQVAEVLGERLRTLRNPANWNNEIGLPLTLLLLRPEHEAAVLEMGLYTTGEIALLASLARPSIGVVTAVRGVHLSRAGSIEAIERGKRELVEALPADGWAVLNADDERVRRMAGHTAARVTTYGFSEAAEVCATAVTSRGTEGMRFALRTPEGERRIETPVLGRHGVHNALAAVAVARCAGLDLDEIERGLARPLAMPHRSQLVRAGEWTILDDSYNASPDAVLAALGLLAELPGRHLAVLGEMLELGDTAAAEHRRVGEAAATLADRLIVVGEGARAMAEGAVARGLAPGDVSFAADRDEAREMLLAELRAGDTVLVKASRGAALDVLVEELREAADGRLASRDRADG